MLHCLTSDNHAFSIGSVVVKSVDVVRDLGVLLDSGVVHETAYQPCSEYRLLPASAETTPTPHHTRHHETTRMLSDTQQN